VAQFTRSLGARRDGAALAGVHALAALTHHFTDRDATLRRMLGGTQHAQPRNHATTRSEP